MGVSTEFILHGMYATPPRVASTDTKGKRGNGRYDGGDTPLAGHDLTRICYPQTLVCSCFLIPTSSLALLQEPGTGWLHWSPPSLCPSETETGANGWRVLCSELKTTGDCCPVFHTTESPRAPAVPNTW